MKARWRLPVMLLAVTALFWLLLDAREVRQAVGEGLALPYQQGASYGYTVQHLCTTRC